MFSAATYADRRRVLAETIGAGLIVIPGNDLAPMNYAGNVHRFTQDGSFRYYAGHDAPSLALVIDADSGAETLVGPSPTLDDAVWDGPAPTIVDRAEAVGIRYTAEPRALAEIVQGARANDRTVHILPPYGGQKLRLAEAFGVLPTALAPSPTLVAAVVAQRLVKTDEEVAEIEVACGIAVEMHELAMRLAQPGVSEQHVAGAMEGLALQHGSYPSFPVILTRRGEVLHGHATGALLQEGDLMLHDAGAVAPGSGYASDLTRTSPVGGTFGEKQRALYEIVLDAQTAAIAACTVGAPFVDIHLLAAKRIVQGLTALGIMRGDADAAVAAGAHALFFPHGLGHALGLDVHDMEGLGEDAVGYGEGYTRSDQFGTAYLRFARPLRPGYVMTVEPGIYLVDPLIDAWRAETRHAAFIDYAALDAWRGLGGIRIEDDVLVTLDGPRVLGPGLAKSVAGVEAMVRGGTGAADGPRPVGGDVPAV